jgi:integrase
MEIPLGRAMSASVRPTSSSYLHDEVTSGTVVPANTVVTGRKVGPVPTRRYQEGCFKTQNGYFYSFFRVDANMPDGSTKSKLTRFNLGQVGKMAERQARIEHDRLRSTINRERGSVPAAPKGETFREMANNYMSAIGPQLSPGTRRQRHSHLNAHLFPRFGSTALMAIDVPVIQKMAADMLIGVPNENSRRKTVRNVVETLFGILDYARKCKIRVPEISIKDIKLAKYRKSAVAYQKPDNVSQILPLMNEPYRSMFSLDWMTGLRAGEVLGLRVHDLDLKAGTVTPQQQSDDQTRVLRELKTEESAKPVQLTRATVAMLQNYLQHHWKPNPLNLLFPSRTNRPMKRSYAVKFGLWPAMRKLGLPTHRVGFHSFRGGLATRLANNKVSPRIVQSILRHADLKTTLSYYVHSDEDVQREALQALQM